MRLHRDAAGRSRLHRGLALAPLLLAAGLASAATQTIDVSKGVSGRNLLPRVAVNPENLDAVVVWTQQIPGTLNLRIWSRLLELRADGTYKTRKPRMVSSATGFNSSPEVVFDTRTNRYVVFWDDFNFFNPLAPSSIHARFLKAKTGRTRGPIKSVVSDGLANTFPRVTTIRAANDTRKMFLGYTAFPIASGQDGTGVAFVQLRKSLRAKGKTRTFFPTALAETGAGGIVAQKNIDDIEERPFVVGFLRDGTISQNPGQSPGKIALGAIVSRFNNRTGLTRGALLGWKGSKLAALAAVEDFDDEDTGPVNAKFIPDRTGAILEAFYSRFEGNRLKVGVAKRESLAAGKFGRFGREFEVGISASAAQFNREKEIPKIFARPVLTNDPKRPIQIQLSLLICDGQDIAVSSLVRTGKPKNTVVVEDPESVVTAAGLENVSNVESIRGEAPGLGKLPILGYVFAAQRRVSATKELILFIRPELIQEK